MAFTSQALDSPSLIASDLEVKDVQVTASNSKVGTSPARSRLQRIKSPCVGVCSTGIGGDVCRGCKRFNHEIIQWNSLNADQLQVIDVRLSKLLSQVMANHVVVQDKVLLQAKLEQYSIEFNSEHSILCWVYALLSAGAGQMSQPQAYGFSLKRPDDYPSLRAFKRRLDKDFYALSCAHYERYFMQAFVGEPLKRD